MALSEVQGCPVAISEIKQGGVNGDELIETEGTVTGVYGAHLNSSSVGSFFIQDGRGEDIYDGLFVYMGSRAETVDIPQVGNRIRVSGRIGDFFGQTQMSNVAQLVAIDSGAITPIDEVLARLDGRELEMESQLICLYDLTVSDVEPEPGPGYSAPTYEYEVTDEDGAFSIRINDALYRPETLPPINTYFERICGFIT